RSGDGRRGRGRVGLHPRGPRHCDRRPARAAESGAFEVGQRTSAKVFAGTETTRVAGRSLARAFGTSSQGVTRDERLTYRGGEGEDVVAHAGECDAEA